VKLDDESVTSTNHDLLGLILANNPDGVPPVGVSETDTFTETGAPAFVVGLTNAKGL